MTILSKNITNESQLSDKKIKIIRSKYLPINILRDNIQPAMNKKWICLDR